MNKYFIKDVFNINTVILNDVSGLHGLWSESALFLLKFPRPQPPAMSFHFGHTRQRPCVCSTPPLRFCVMNCCLLSAGFSQVNTRIWSSRLLSRQGSSSAAAVVPGLFCIFFRLGCILLTNTCKKIHKVTHYSPIKFWTSLIICLLKAARHCRHRC